MKYISFTVPCYNSQGYMKKCIDSLLTAGNDVEIIIVNDGSTDGTLQIANEYARSFPQIVRVIDHFPFLPSSFSFRIAAWNRQISMIRISSITTIADDLVLSPYLKAD